MLTQDFKSNSFPDFIPSIASQLTEIEAINFLKNIQRVPVSTPLIDQKILTAFVQKGEGDLPILLCHGFDSSGIEFRKLLPLLGETTKVWSVDLLGFGFTDRLKNLSINPDSIKIHLHSFWQQYIKKPVVLLGTSMGGAAALDFTLAYPELVDKLILIASAGLANPPIMGKLMFPPLDRWATQFLASAKVRKSIIERAYYNQKLIDINAEICGSIHLEMPNWADSLISFTKGGGYGNFSKKLNKIKQKTLIVWGKCDKILGTKDAPKFKELIPNSDLIWLAQCGHFPQIEKVNELREHIINFLDH